MSKLELDVQAAKALGLSYGKYKAMTYTQAAPMASPQKRPQRRPRRFTDAEAFTLWQDLKTDAEMGKILGVSRAYIQRWRDQLELPSTTKTKIDTKKYRLSTLKDGTTIAIQEDDLL